MAKKGKAKPAAAGKNDQTGEMHAQVQEVVGIMQQNVDKVVERETKLTDLHQMADRLQNSSETFSHCGAKLKRKQKLRYMKYTLLLILVSVVLVAIVGLVIYAKFFMPASSSSPSGGGGSGSGSGDKKEG